MKKSDMVAILHFSISEHTGVDGACCNLGINKEALSKVIDDLEKAGMLPPESNGKTLYGLFTDNRWDKE